MYKRGKINTDWRQRLFVLNGKQLAYFKGGVSIGNVYFLFFMRQSNEPMNEFKNVILRLYICTRIVLAFLRAMDACAFEWNVTNTVASLCWIVVRLFT